MKEILLCSEGHIFYSDAEKIRQICDELNQKLAAEGYLSAYDALDEIYEARGISNDIDKWEAD